MAPASSFAALSLLLVAAALGPSIATAAPGASIALALDATQTAQKIYRVKERIDGLAPGPFAFVYPKWIPGYHAAVGPIEGVVSLQVAAAGRALDWRRDLVDPYEVRTIVPTGASSLEIDFDIVGAESRSGQLEPESTSRTAIVEFSNFVVYPAGAVAVQTPVDASLTLPAGWTFGTALPVANRTGSTVAFKPASLYTVVDSPVIAGAYERSYRLSPLEELDVSGDSARSVEPTANFLTGMKHLVAEGPALYGGRHYRDYHFLLTTSDPIGYEGIEHHESSDDRAPEDYVEKDENYLPATDLLAHEYSHSWNGKYRRPADLATPDYQAPELTDLLWVYEGLNEFNGEKLATRAQINTFATQLDKLALTAANMDYEAGRAWRPVRDTADGAPFLYGAPREYYNLRRSAGDFYAEGDLIWLDADVTMRKLTGGTKSLDDFCKLWGNGSDTASVPAFDGYDRAEVIALLNRVVPYDWAAFFKARIDDVSKRAPLDGIRNGGYALAYTGTRSELEKKQNEDRKVVDERFSIGLSVGGEDGRIGDVLVDSAAFAAGIAPGDTIVAVDGRKFKGDVLTAAIEAHKGVATPLSIIYSDGDYFRTASIDASAGERFPHLVRVPGTPDVLKAVYAPRTFVPVPEPIVTPQVGRETHPGTIHAE